MKEYFSDVLYFYSYCLLPNHFHLLIRVKEVDADTDVSKIFSNFFNSYSKSINKEQNRYGALFQKPFKRKVVENEDYLRILVNYIHRNPVHHNICKNANDYQWSSYNSILNGSDDILEIEGLMDLFGNRETFAAYVNQSIEDYKNLNIE